MSLLAFFDRKKRFFIKPLIVLMLIMGVGVVSAPRPAQAYIICYDPALVTVQTTNWAQQFVKWASLLSGISTILDIITFIQNLLNKMLDKINESINAIGRTINAGQKGQSKIAVDIGQATIDANAADHLFSERAAQAAKSAKVTNGHLCNNLIANQTLGQYGLSRFVARLLTGGVLNAGRGPSKDYALQRGPSINAMRCGKLNSGDPKTMGAIDGVSGCIGEDGSGNDRSLQDADISATLLDRDQALELPNLTPGDVPVGPNMSSSQIMKVSIASASTPKQKLWMAARGFLYNLAGGHPSPPYGAQITSSGEGQAAMGKFLTCTSRASVPLSQVALRIGMLTRGNTSISGFDKTCEARKNLCKIVKDVQKVDLPADIDCSACLSDYERDLLNHMKCLGILHYVSMAETGATQQQMLSESTKCMDALTSWNGELAVQDTAFVAAVSALNSLSSCWIGAEKNIGRPIGSGGATLSIGN